MLRHDRDDYGRIFRTLTFVNGRRIGRHEHVKFPKSVSDRAAVKAGNDFAGIGVDIVDVTDIAVVDLFVVIIFDLHDFVAGGESPAEPFHLAIAGGIERCLQLDVQRAGAYASYQKRCRVYEALEGFAPGTLVRRRYQDTIDIKYPGCQSCMTGTGKAGFSKGQLPDGIHLSRMVVSIEMEWSGPGLFIRLSVAMILLCPPESERVRGTRRQT